MTDAGSTLDARVVGDDAYAVLVLAGTVNDGCAWQLKDALVSSERRDRGHVIVDVRQVQSMTREAVKVLLWELGRAFDDGRTLRLVVRDLHQKRSLDALGVACMLPMHESLQDAMGAVDEALTARASTERVIRLDIEHAPAGPGARGN